MNTSPSDCTRIAIVTDSTGDIPASLASELAIHVIPAILIIDGQSIKDGSGLTRAEFYARLPDMRPLPTTATPSAGAFETQYQALFDQGFQHIISIHVASRLSGIFSTARLAAQPFGDRITVLDSESLSMGMGFQVIAAAEAAAEGATYAQIIAAFNSTRQRVRVFAMLDTLEFMHRSGRVGWTKSRIGSLLRIKPFVEVRDGGVHSLGQTRTRQRGIAQLKDYLADFGSLERLAILHSTPATDAHAFLASLAPDLSVNPPLLRNITTIVGTHTGPNGLGWAAVPRYKW